MKRYFELFRKTKKILDEKQVSLIDYKKVDDGIAYFFTVKDYNITLVLSRLNNTKTSIWKREFTCDCRASIRATNEMCSHILAVQSWLVQNHNFI